MSHAVHSARLALLALLAVVAGAPAALAAPPPLPESRGEVLHVSPSGNDADAGSSDDPFRTISRAVSAAEAGQRIVVRGGTYRERLEIRKRGAAGAPITIEAAEGARPVVNTGVRIASSSHVRLRGLVFDGSGTGGWGINVFSSDHIELSRNEIRDYGSRSNGLFIHESDDVHMLGNVVHDVGGRRPYDHGVYCNSGRRVVIASNVFRDLPAGFGVHLWGDCDDALVLNNTIHDNHASGIAIGGNGDVGHPDRVLVANNIISGHTNTSGDGQLGWGVAAYRPGGGVLIRDNLFHDNARGSFEPTCGGCTRRDNLEADPRYGDGLRLRPGSPALGRATNEGLRFDAAGAARVQGEPDLGAYESGSG